MLSVKIKLDPRLKICLLLILILILVFSQNPITMMKILIFLFFFLTITDLSSLKRYILIALFSSAMILVASVMFLQLEQITLLIMLARLNSFIIIFFWFYIDLSPEDLAQTLVWFQLSYRKAMYISTAFRYIFYFRKETESISHSLMLRGVPLDTNFLSRLRSFHYVLPPLVLRTSHKAQIFSIALFSKNWSPFGKKTVLHPFKFNYRVNIIFILLLFTFLLL